MRFLFLSASNFRPKLGLLTGEDLQYSAVEKRVQTQYTVQSEWEKFFYRINDKSHYSLKTYGCAPFLNVVYCYVDAARRRNVFLALPGYSGSPVCKLDAHNFGPMGLQD